MSAELPKPPSPEFDYEVIPDPSLPPGWVKIRLKKTGKELILDEDRFLQNPDAWDEFVAEFLFTMFEKYGERMTEEHWKVVRYLHDYYVTYGVCPPIRMLLKETGMDLKKIHELFPNGPAKGACKVAGAPKPTGCV